MFLNTSNKINTIKNPEGCGSGSDQTDRIYHRLTCFEQVNLGSLSEIKQLEGVCVCCSGADVQQVVTQDQHPL